MQYQFSVAWDSWYCTRCLNSNNWLFTSQGRTKELFHWGIIGSVIVVTSFFIGIPWGINGVAASYGLIDLLICSPILVWMVGRRGHVSSFEYLRSLKDGFMLSLIIAVFCITIKNLWYTGIPIYNFLIMAGSAIAAVLFAICISKNYDMHYSILLNYLKQYN